MEQPLSVLVLTGKHGKRGHWERKEQDAIDTHIEFVPSAIRRAFDEIVGVAEFYGGIRVHSRWRCEPSRNRRKFIFGRWTTALWINLSCDHNRAIGGTQAGTKLRIVLKKCQSAEEQFGVFGFAFRDRRTVFRARLQEFLLNVFRRIVSGLEHSRWNRERKANGKHQKPKHATSLPQTVNLSSWKASVQGIRRRLQVFKD